MKDDRIERVERILSDPLARRKLLESLDEDLQYEIFQHIEPAQLSREALDAARLAVEQRLAPPPAVLALLARWKGRLVGSTHAALRSLVAPLEEMRGILESACFSPAALGHLSSGTLGSESLPLRLMPFSGEERRERCALELLWDPEGRVRGELRVPGRTLGSTRDWERGWFVLAQRDGRFALCAQYEVRAAPDLTIPIDEPAPHFEFGDDLPLPVESIEVTLVQLGAGGA